MDAGEKQERRLTAAALFEQGELRDGEIAELLGVSARAVNYWRHAWQDGGAEALSSKGPTGPDGYLDDSQRFELRGLLRRGAKNYGFATDGWTLARVNRVIKETFTVVYADPSGVWRLLRAMGWSCQAPARRAIERDDDRVVEWVEQTWPDIEKRGTGRGRGSALKTRPGPR